MLDGLDDVEEEQYLEDNPKIIPLFEDDIAQTHTHHISVKKRKKIFLLTIKPYRNNDSSKKLWKER